jgi:predicted metal-dependent peptidase
MEYNLEPDRLIKKAIIEMQVKQPFYAHISTYMKVKETESVPTMGVDAAWNFYFNKKWVGESIPDFNTLIGCVCHETLHLALNHIGRIGNRNPVISNIAQDMVVNMICVNSDLKVIQGPDYVNVNKLRDIAFMDIPGKGKKITINNVSNKSWEKIYNELIDELDEEDFGKCKYVFDEHMHESFNELSKEEQNQLTEKAKQVLTDSFVYAKNKGKLPGGIERFVKELLEPKIPWNIQLMKYIKNHSDPIDWSYRKPHRKSHSLGVYLPNLKKERINIEVLIDVSGSIDIRDYTEFITELYSMMNVIPNIVVDITYMDSRITEEIHLTGSEKARLLSIKPKGGGGTDMEDGLEHISSKNRNSPVCVVLTDGYTHCLKNGNSFPFEVIWTISEKGMEKKDALKHFRYGKVIKM